MLGEAPIQIYAAARKHREMPMGQQILPKVKALFNVAEFNSKPHSAKAQQKVIYYFLRAFTSSFFIA